jgi:type IX secretion system PorP/SprF family membrane protein
MKKYFIPVALIFFSFCLKAQQLPEVSYFMYDYTRTNPGSLGSTDMFDATIIQKSVFINFPGHPVDFYGSAEMPFNLFGGKHGVGFSILNDVLGNYNNYDVKLGYAFRFNVGDGTLGIGVSGSYIQNELEGTWVGTPSYNPTNDPNIPDAKSDGKGFGISAGLFYRADDIYFGASVLNAYASEIEYKRSLPSTSTPKEILRPHYYITSGYYLQLTNPAFELAPAINLYSDGTIVTFDLNTTLTYNKKIWGGVSYRAGSAVIGMLGIAILDGLKVGFAYDFQTSTMNRYSSGSTEILVNYCFKIGLEKTPQRYKSIRYL